MKRSYIFIGGFLIFILIITIVGSNIVTGNTSIKKEKDILSVQSNKEVYFNGYGYSLDNPNVIINPYGNSPLTGIAMFETSDYSEVSISVNGDINYTFGKNKHHIIPIYGLYADYDNTIVLRSENKEKVINIKTDKLPDDFGEVLYDGNYSFYNDNYPYASDSNGNVRWYLNKKYYGNSTVVDEQIALEWARIPHFYSNFYVYKYATGFSAASALSQKILTEGKVAVDKYIEFLKSGGSDYPLNQLKAAGVDMEKKESVDKALEVFKELVDKLEKEY